MAPRSPAEYQATQADLAVLLAADVGRHAWPLLVPGKLTDTLPQLIVAVAALVRRYGTAAASVASGYYARERAAARVASRFTVTPADAPSLERVESGVRWATKSLWAPRPDVEPVRELVEGVAQTMVADTARDTIIDNSRRDPKARGWARVPEPTACSFCMLLATRGAVYKHETVTFRAHEPHLNKTGKRVGGVCQCHAEPVFHAYEPPAAVRAAQGVYAQVKHSTPAEMRSEFRRLYEASQKAS